MRDDSLQIECPVCSQIHVLAVPTSGDEIQYRCADKQVRFALRAGLSDELNGQSSVYHECTIESIRDPQQTAAEVLATRPISQGARALTLVGGHAAPAEEAPQEPKRQPSLVGAASAVSQIASEYGFQSDVDDDQRYGDEYRIAAGGMGKILMTRDQDIGREVAMKTMLPRFREDPSFVVRFLNEARTVGQLEHPNIVPVYDVGMKGNGEPFFTMKLVRGETLADVIDRLLAGSEYVHNMFTWARRVNILQQICDALQFAHSKGYLHRDLKPENIMIGQYGEVMVMDWGLAIPVHGAGPPSGEGLVGTPEYMSPEQARTEKTLSPASDVYAIGAIAYALLGLRAPYSGDSVFEILNSVLTEEPPRLDSLKVPGQAVVPIELQYIVRQAMAKDLADRHSSAASLKADLQLFLDGKYPIVCPHTALKRAVQGVSRLVDSHAKLIIVFALLGVALVIMALTVALAT